MRSISNPQALIVRTYNLWLSTAPHGRLAQNNTSSTRHHLITAVGSPFRETPRSGKTVHEGAQISAHHLSPLLCRSFQLVVHGRTYCLIVWICVIICIAAINLRRLRRDSCIHIPPDGMHMLVPECLQREVVPREKE